MTSLFGRIRRKLGVQIRTRMGYEQDASALGQQANLHWNNFDEQRRAEQAHWRGHGVFTDEQLWLRLGGQHRELLDRMLLAHGQQFRSRFVVEWGCGGGMNAVHFGKGAERYWGVDISQATLDECARQMQREGLQGFEPVLVDANQPRAALEKIHQACDLFICTYVFELLPTEAHAWELLELAYDVLAPGAHALIHIRYGDGSPHSRSRPWDYAQNLAHNVTFTVDDFSAACQRFGFQVLGCEKQDSLPELNERNYAYFLLQR